MLRFLFHKLLNKKWMILCLLIGNTLMIAIACSCALYENAIMQKMLTSNLASYMEEENRYPGITLMSCAVKEVSYDEDYARFRELSSTAEDFAKTVGLKESEFITHYFRTINVISEVQSSDGDSTEVRVAMGAYSRIEDYITITAGELYSREIGDDHVIEAIIPQRTLINQNLMVGETLRIRGFTDAEGNEYKLRVAGVFEPKDNADLYWYSSPANWMQSFIIDYDLYRQLIEGGLTEDRMGFNVEWASVVRYTDFKGNEASGIVERFDAFKEDYEESVSKGVSSNFYDILTEYVREASKLRVTLLVLQVPIFVLLAAFIFMVSRQMLEMEQNEIAIYKSRGASKRQIISLYLLQSVILIVIALLLGLPFGYFICQVIGSANAFLDFVRRSALPISFTAETWLYVSLAVIVSVCAMVIPVFRHANVTIVAHKQKKARKHQSPLWQKFFLDFILLAAALYGHYLFNQNMDYLAETMAEGSSLGPILYLSSSIFILGAGLLLLRLFPWIVRLIFLIGRRFWSPSLYASFLRIMRSRGNQGFMMVFLIMTVSLGIFNAQAARTINENGEDKIRYTNGADLVVREIWEENKVAGEDDGQFIEPDISRYYDMEEIENFTRVYRTKVNVSVDGGQRGDVDLMAINTKEFGEIAWFKDGLLPIHWYNYLNAISQDAEAVLLSENFATDYGIKIGDVINYRNSIGSSRGVVYGFVDYWPGFTPRQYIKDEDGRTVEEPNYLVVASFNQVQSEWGVYPYEIWMKIKGSSQFLYDFAAEEDVHFAVFHDTAADLIAWKNDPVTQGTNGVLTVGFIVVLILCAAGFLIFWILSIQSRVLQFGIFRAMGMSMREILSMLGIEQLFISGLSIAFGAVIGRVASSLFIPMIQIAYSAAETVIPLELANASSDYLKLFLVIGFVVAVCMGILSVLISRIRISQALKLGED